MVFLSNPTGQVLIQHKSITGATVEYTVKDSDDATVFSGSMTEITSTGLFYEYIDMSGADDEVYLVYYNINGRVAEEFNQIWKGLVVES